MTFYAAYDIVSASTVNSSHLCAFCNVAAWQIEKYLPRDAILVNEGSATMDIGRTVFQSHYPRKRYIFMGETPVIINTLEMNIVGSSNQDPLKWVPEMSTE